MLYRRISNMANTTDATSGSASADHTGSLELNPNFSTVRFAMS